MVEAGPQHSPDWTLKTLPDMALGGRITMHNGMLVGLGVDAHQRDPEFRIYQEFPKMIQAAGYAFCDVWNKPNETVESPRLRQRLELLGVHIWLSDDTVEKTAHEIGSAKAFLATGNAFDWEKNPDLLERMRKIMRHISDDHAEVALRKNSRLQPHPESVLT